MKDLARYDIMPNKPIITIIIPVYNAENTLHIAMDSILAQTYHNLEIIIINDCSKDNTSHVIHKYEAKLFQHKTISIKVLNHVSNRGVAAARITGLDNASGNIFIMLMRMIILKKMQWN